MGFLKGLFLSVYTSNRIVRSLFLPLCYLLLSTPFLLVFARYYGYDSRLSELFGRDKSVGEIALQLFVGLVAVSLPTRILSGKDWNADKNGGARKVQQIPYWIPLVRHWGNIVLRGEGWLKKIRDSVLVPVVAFNLGGAKHNLILSPSLLEQVQKDSSELDELDVVDWAVLRNAFNLPGNMEKGYRELRPDLKQAFHDNMFENKNAEDLISATLSILSDSLPDLVTFNSSIVDQLPWERVANLELTDGTSEAECDLFTLINEFFCNAILAPITGAAFTESYQLLASDLSTVTELYYALALGLPRLFPKPGLPGAVLARKRLFQNFVRFFDDLDNPKKRVPDDDESMSGEETDADTPTPLTRMNEFFVKKDVPLEARAAIAIQSIHALVAEVVPLAFWTLVHLHTSVAAQAKTHKADTLIDEIRKETQIWALAVQPPSIHPAFPAPPAISFSGLPRLVSPTSFPHLRSAINESRRLYKAPIATLKVTKPFTLTETESIRPDAGEKEKWQLDDGSYVALGLSQTLINTSAAHFLAPTEYKPDRFHRTAAPLSVTSPSDPQEALSTSLLVAFVAGVLQLWDISPAPKKTFYDHMQEAQAAAMGPVEGNSAAAAAATATAPVEQTGAQGMNKKVGEWVVPSAVDGPSVRIPRVDVRVRIRRREGLPEQRSLRKGR